MDKFQYGGLLFEPSHYQTLSYIESKHNNKLFINPDFKKGKAGYMQLSPIAFADLKQQGFFKDREYNSLTPQEVLAGSMKYASRLGEHYGFTDPKWNAAAYNMGPSKARALYDKYGGKLNKAVLDPDFPQTTKDYLFDYNYTTLTKDRHGNEDVNKMYDIIKNDRDVNSLSITPSKKAMGGVPIYQAGGPTTTNPLYQDSLNLHNVYEHYQDFLINQNKLYGNRPINEDEYTDIRNKYNKYYPKEIKKYHAAYSNLTDANGINPKRIYNSKEQILLTIDDPENVDRIVQIRGQFIKPTNIPKSLPSKTANNIAATKKPVVTAAVVDTPIVNTPVVDTPIVNTPVVVPPRVQYWDKNGKITTEDTFLDKWPQRKYYGGVPNNVNSLNIDTMKIKKTPKYFWGAIIQAAANKVKEEKAKDKAFMNSSNMGAAGTALGSVITSAGDAIGTQEDASKANVIQGAAVSTLGGLMSGGIMGGLIAAPTSLIKYSANAIAQGSRKESQQEAWINGHTTGIDTGTNYQFKMGGVAKYHMGSDTHDTDPPKGNTYGVPVKDTIYPNGNNKFLFDKYKNPDYIVHSQTKGRELNAFEKTLDIVDRTLSAPSRYMVQAITGKYQDPSQAWGYKDPKGFLQNAANVGIDMVADPLNALGVGVASKVGTILKTGRRIVPEAATIAEATNMGGKGAYYATSAIKAKDYLRSADNFNNLKTGAFDWDKFKDYTNIVVADFPELKETVTRSLKLNKPEATLALINDAINVKNTATNTYEPHYSKTSDFGPLAAGYKNLPQANKTAKMTKKLTTIPVKQSKVAETLAASPAPMVMNQFNRIVNGKKVPISKEEFQSINSKGKVTSDTMPSYLKGMIPDSLKNKQKLEIRDISKKEMGGYSIEGYKKNSPDRNNAFNIIPGTNISMQNVLHKVLGIGSNGQKQIMMPGQQYNFGASTYVTEIPIKKETGGAPEVVPMSQITPLQASKDELVIHPNYDVTKTAARKTHAEYTKTGQNEKVSDTLQPLQRDQLGNVIAPGAYVVSNAKELKIPVALAKQISLGVDPAYYAKNEHLPEAKERNVADEFFNNKKEMTPAELLKSVLKKIPEPKRDSKTDMFAKQTSAMNKEARVPMLEIIKKTNDFLRNINAPQGDEQEAMHNPEEEMLDPNGEQMMYAGGVPRYQYGTGVMPSYLKYPMYDEAYQINNNLDRNGGNVLTGALRTPGDGNPLPATPYAPDNSSPFLNTSITKDWRADYLKMRNSPEAAAVTKYSQPGKAGSTTPDYMQTLLQQIQNRKYPGNANNAALAALANGFGASMLSALQNPTNEVYATNPTLMDRKFAPEDINLRTRIYDNSLANRDAITLKGLESTGVSAQKSQFYLQSNDNVEKRNAAVLSAIQANNQLGRAKANAIDQNRKGIVDQNNANQKDYNRYLYNITKPLADTAGNIGNIYQRDAENRMAFDDRKERDMVSVQQGQYMMDFLNKQSGVTPAASGTTNTSTIPIFTGTTQEEWEAFKKKYNIV